MKKLGLLHSKARNGLLVVKSMVKNPVKVIGAIVYDRDMNRIGLVTDVIGRVDEPFLIVKPDAPEKIEDLEINSILYYYIPQRRRSRRGRGRKSRRPR